MAKCDACGVALQDGAGGLCPTCGAVLAGTVPSRAPATPRTPPPREEPEPPAARLVVLRGEGRTGEVLPVAGDELHLGRPLFPDDPCLAPLQATILVRDGAVALRDEGAPGGVLVRLRGPTVPLRPGSLFAIGEHLLRFAGPLPPPAAPDADGTRRLGAPRPDGAVVLEEWLEGGVAGRVWVRAGPVTLGRAGCAVELDGADVAEAHAELLVGPDGAARLRDLGSPAGTFVRMPPGSERALADGDVVRLGREVVRVELP